MVHTLAGNDHYQPFIAIARRRGWSAARAACLTFACGVAHVGSSLVLGLAGYGLGSCLALLGLLPAVRGEVAAWFLIACGLAYATWGINKARAEGPDGHTHAQAGMLHSHDHIHDPATNQTILLTPGLLLAIFAFSPCAPLIPFLVYPAATTGWAAAMAVACVFAAATLVSMVGAVVASLMGFEVVTTAASGRYSHAIAGACVALAGGAIQVFGT